jgi:hypothetical protein
MLILNNYDTYHLFLSSPEDIHLYCCVDCHNHKTVYTQQDAVYKVGFEVLNSDGYEDFYVLGL